MQAARRGETPARVRRSARPVTGAWSRKGVPSGELETRTHWVTAVVVAHDGACWLPRTLAALGSQLRQPDRVIAIDTGSTDSSALLLASSPVVHKVITMAGETSFGAAVAAAEQGLGSWNEPAADEDDAPVEWLWLVHDDSAPEPSALQELLAEATRSPSASVLGPKVRGWDDEALLLECGLSVTNSGRRFTGLEPGDRDQGQRDDQSDVLAVGSPGMLVRREIWRMLSGFDPDLPLFGDDVEFCMRARRADQRVLVVPGAIVHHREAGRNGARPNPVATRHPSLACRYAELHTVLVHGPMLLLPLTSVRLLLRSLAACLILLPSDGTRRALGEVGVWFDIHRHPVRVVKARRRLRRVAVLPRRELTPYRPTLRRQLTIVFERMLVRARALVAGDGRPIPLGLADALAIAVILGAVAVAATRDVWTSRGPLAGGALLPSTDGATLASGFLASWHDVGLGSSEPAAVYPLWLAAASAAPVMTAEWVVQVMLLFAVPLAAGSAYLALRGLRNRAVRVALAVAYGMAPAALATSLDGRLGTAAVAVLLPWLLRLLLRLMVTDGGGFDLPPAGRRTLLAAILVLTVCASFVPLVWVAVTALTCCAAAAMRVRPRGGWWRTALLLAAPVVLLWPWSGALIADPGRVMFEAGVSSPSLVASQPPGFGLILLDPGTLGASVHWAALPLLAAAVAALAWEGSRRAAIWGWTIVVVALAAATVQTSQQFVPLGAASAQPGYAGPMLLLLAAGLVAAAAAGAQALPPGCTPSWRIANAAIVALLLVGPLGLAMLWITQLDGPLGRTDEQAVPAFVAEEAVSADRIRTILLSRGSDGTVAYALVNGNGGRLGDADVAPPAWTWSELSAAVGELAAGVGPQPAAVLADNAVRYIVADTSDAPLTSALDANPQLQRVSTAEGRALWRVQGETARARLVAPQGVQPVPMFSPRETLKAGGVLLSTEVDPGADGADLVVAQVDDGHWSATVGSQPVGAEGDLAITVALPPGSSAEVALVHDGWFRTRALLAPLAGIVALCALLLIPWRSRRLETDQPREAAPSAPSPQAPPVAPDVVDITDATRQESQS